MRVVICTCLVLVGLSGALRLEAAKEAKNLEWWQESVIYQIYPMSFRDSNCDGIGDLNGITSKLDYLADLGVTAVWISPIYKSPMKDLGYDVSDYKDVDPVFGTLDDFRNMLAEFKKRGIKLIMDLVLNHSSDKHEWFTKSIHRADPYTDYYVWKDPKGHDSTGKPIPPSNWVCHFGGSMWEWNNQRQQFYLHQFAKQQPDLNYHNIKIRNEILAVVKFWLDMGVDGFRVDAPTTLYEDERYLDEPPNPKRSVDARPNEWSYYSHIYTQNLPGVVAYLADVRQLLDIYTTSDGEVRCMMTESDVPDNSVGDCYGYDDKPVAHLPFNFHLLKVTPNSNASEILELVNVWYKIMPEGKWANFLVRCNALPKVVTNSICVILFEQLGNHDQKRAPTRWTESAVDGANMINLLVPGTPITYFGEELGMTDTFLTWEETVDLAACNTDPERYQLFSRDPARTPMQWDNSTGAGFSTTNATWLPLNPNYPTLNAQAQLAADESHLKVYRELVKLRNTTAWKYGSYESLSLNNDRVLAFARIPATEMDDTGFAVIFNLSNDTLAVDATTLSGVPSSGRVVVRSVGFQAQTVLVGQPITTTAIPLGPKNSLVIEFQPNSNPGHKE